MKHGTWIPKLLPQFEEIDSTLLAMMTGGKTPTARRVLVVTAHPDDESFGPGGILSVLVAQSTRISVLCFTHGENSALGVECLDLGMLRSTELDAAASALGVDHATLLHYPDGQLADISRNKLIDDMLMRASGADVLLGFDESGTTGHLDQCAATDAALGAADMLDLPVFAWTVPETVTEVLNPEFGTSFVGQKEDKMHIMMEIDRTRQHETIACHCSQSTGNPVHWRRLNALGRRERQRCWRELDERPWPARAESRLFSSVGP